MIETSQSSILRSFGIDLVGFVPWGTHLCQFYESKEDLIDILVPYFAEGLRSNEFCMWVTSPPLEVVEATEALRKVVPDLNEYLGKGQIEIISYDDWYMLGGKFDSDRVLQGWVEKETAALKRGFEGLRLTGNTFWIERDLWKSFVDYEEAVNAVIGQHKMIAVCTYCLTKCTGTDVLDVIRNHVGTLVKQGDKWYLVEDATRRKAANGALRLSEQRYSALFENMQDGFAYHKILLDEAGKPLDYVFLEVNEAFERLTGLKRENVLGKAVTQVLLGIENDPADWINVYGKVALTGKPARFENYSEALSKWYLVSAYSPEKGYFAATFEDISERKKSENAIRSLKERFEMAQQAARVGVWDWNVKTGHIEWTPEMFRLFGLDSRKHIASFEIWNAVLHPDDRDKAGAKIDEALKTHSFLDNEYRIVRPDGQIIWINALGHGEYDDQNQPTRMSGICIDITARKKAEEALRDSERRWATTLSSIGDAVIATDIEGNISFMNQVAEKLTGWVLSEANCKPLEEIFNIVNEQTHLEVENPVSRVLKEGMIIGLANHTILLRRDGTEVPIDDSGAPIRDQYGKVTGVVLVFRDISERKRTETELQETKDYLESLFNYANAPIIVWDPSFRITRFNRAFERLTGLSSNDVIGKTLDMLFPHDTRKKSMAHIKRTLKGEHWETVEIPVRYVDGSVKTLLWNSANIYDSDGKKIVATIAQGHDITERKKTSAALRESQRDLKRAQTVARTGSWRLDVKRNVLLWSDETYRMFGIPKRTPLTYERFLRTVHPDDRAEVDQKWQAALLGKPYDIEHRIIVNSKIKWVREKAELEFDNVGTLRSAFGTVQDITEAVKLREKLEDSAVQLEEYSSQMEQLANERAEKLKDAERLAAIGATAGMVGHDIRNPLQAIIGDLYLVKSDLALVPDGREKESMKESLIAIEESVDYIDKIVQDLQDYAKPLKPALQETDLEGLCIEVLEKNGLPKNITSSCQMKKDAKKIISDSTLLRRILTNLKNNAVQAMPNGGKLEFHVYKDADDIVITVQDTGVGIPEEITPQLFTPLFTTKSKGQGFGLPVVKRMTEALQGTVTFESEEGKGTKFTVRLPQKEVTAT